jgi:hypothetical protein
MSHVAPRSRTISVPDELRRNVAALVAELGPRRAAAQLEISRHTALSVALGAPVTRGTVALVERALARRSAA